MARKDSRENLMLKRHKRRLHPEALRRFCDPDRMPFKTTDELANPTSMVGQSRALRAIEMGLDIPSRGYNIFALGDSGSGKTTNVLKLLNRRASKEPVPEDICYVYNFDDPAKPRVLFFPAGEGRKFAQAVERLVRDLKKLIPGTLSEQPFRQERSIIRTEAMRKQERLFRKYAKEARKLNLDLEEEDGQIMVLPIVDGEVLDMEAFESLSYRQQRDIESRAASFTDRTMSYARQRRKLDRIYSDKLMEAERRYIAPMVGMMLEELKEDFEDLGEDISGFIDQVEEHVLINHQQFLPSEEVEESSGEMESEEDPSDVFRVYEVNVLVDRSRLDGAPVIFERSPSLSNLVGFFEYRESAGALKTDHTLIRPGVLHRANGGYLVLQVDDLLGEEDSWTALTKALRHKEVLIEEERSAEGRPRLAGQLEPEPVPVNTKVILIGSTDVYYQFKVQDDEFNRLFKIKADFESSIPRTLRNEKRLSRFLGQVAREEKYPPLRKDAVARILEHSSRLAEDQRRLSARTAGMLDLMAEAVVYTRRSSRKYVTCDDVTSALEDRYRRHSGIVEAVLREFSDGTILLNTGGAVVGQVNGTAVYDLGDIAFGVPCRITARTYVGRSGVMNIDREVHLTGAIHDKGAMIMVGFLGGRFATDKPLSMSASITFEQAYEEIEGDSASVAELFALLSSLADLPIRQGIAVTGSVNQLGEIQPIGGVNEKIEGVYRIWKKRGLSGNEGVLIPRKNERNLMLSEEVISAVRKGKFHVLAVDHVDEGIELLTGIPAGKIQRNGNWPKNTVNFLVDQKLRTLSRNLLENESWRPVSETLS